MSPNLGPKKPLFQIASIRAIKSLFVKNHCARPAPSMDGTPLFVPASRRHSHRKIQSKLEMMTEIREAGVHYLLNLMTEGCAFFIPGGDERGCSLAEGPGKKRSWNFLNSPGIYFPSQTYRSTRWWHDTINTLLAVGQEPPQRQVEKFVL